MNIIKSSLITGACLVALVLSASNAMAEGDYVDPRDPYEGFNRSIYNFNEGLDNAVLKPVAEGYQTVMPAPFSMGVTNFFANLEDVGSAINSLLQLKLGNAVSDAGRVIVNSTIGVFGLFDVATRMDIKKYPEDFGQTLGSYGAGPGPYMVLPVFGPSNARDTVGFVADWYLDPVTYVEPEKWRWRMVGLRAVDDRANLLGASKILEQAALDPYEFVRDGYLQKRHSDIHDGNPPEMLE